MRTMARTALAGVALSLLAAAPGAVIGQSEVPAEAPAAASQAAPAPAPQAAEQTGQVAGTPAAAEAAGAPAAPVLTEPAKRTYTVPAGTKVLLQLRSALNTKSAKPGDGVYLASTFPVVVGSKVMIPAGVYVQGVVDRVERAGRVKGKAQLDMHFTSIIFPNGSVVEIPGLVNSLPGASQQNVKNDGEGTIEQSSDKTRNMGKVAEVSIPTGGTVGSISGLGSGHPLAGGLTGIAAGVGAAALVSLFTRGADVNIQQGTQVEMVLQRPLILEDENLSGFRGMGTESALVPASAQPRPMEKPRRARIMCPPGGLGCE
jgi:hypothetical protein